MIDVVVAVLVLVGGLGVMLIAIVYGSRPLFVKRDDLSESERKP